MTREEILSKWPGLSEQMIERLQRPWSLEQALADIERQVSESYQPETSPTSTDDDKGSMDQTNKTTELHISTPEEMAARIAEPEVKGWLLGPPLSFEEAQKMVNEHHRN